MRHLDLLSSNDKNKTIYDTSQDKNEKCNTIKSENIISKLF